MRKDCAEVVLLLRQEIGSQLIDGKLTFKDPPLVYGVDIDYTFGDNHFVYFMSENQIDRIKNDQEYGRKFASYYISLLINYLRKKKVDPWIFIRKSYIETDAHRVRN